MNAEVNAAGSPTRREKSVRCTASLRTFGPDRRADCTYVGPISKPCFGCDQGSRLEGDHRCRIGTGRLPRHQRARNPCSIPLRPWRLGNHRQPVQNRFFREPACRAAARDQGPRSLQELRRQGRHRPSLLHRPTGGSSRASSARTMPASRRRCASSSVSTDPLQGTPRSAASTTSSCSARCRVDEVLELVGLHDVAHERAGTFSLGIGQRLGLAAALIGDPSVLILDEPVNGLAPDGIM